MNLLYCVDENFNKQLYTSIYSIISNGNQVENLIILHKNPKTLKKHVFENYLKKNINNLLIIKFDETLLPDNLDNSIFKNSHISLATFYRLFISFYIPQNINNLLYLDADIICNKNFENEYKEVFENLNKQNKVIGARTTGTRKTNIEMFESISLLGNNYFNAGVLFIDYNKWLKNRIYNKLIEILKMKDFKHHDQDILNLCFDDNYYELSPWLNFNIKVNETKEVQKAVDIEVRDHVLLMHYVGEQKPWDIDFFETKNSSYYHNYYSQIFNGNYHIKFKKDFRNILKMHKVLNTKFKYFNY